MVETIAGPTNTTVHHNSESAGAHCHTKIAIGPRLDIKDTLPVVTAGADEALCMDQPQ